MNNQWEGLVTTVQKFTEYVKEELNEKNGAFHSVLNGDTSIAYRGIACNQEVPNEYLVNVSDVLFWDDPIAYLDELERWENQSVRDQHIGIKKYLEATDQVNVFERFVESLKRKRIAPFIGAGFSRPCNYPLWGEAIEKLIRKLEGVSASEENAMLPALAYLGEVKECIRVCNYLKAAQLIYENHCSHMENFVRNTFDGAASREVTGPIALLPYLADGCIITTNFDGLIENVFNKHNRSIEGYMHGIQTGNSFAAKLIQGERCILKLHGHYDSPKTYIFSESQYNDAYGNGVIDYQKPLAKTLRQIYVSHSLLFLGCSLEQDRTLELFKDVADSDAFDIPAHFTILPMPEEHTKRMEKEALLTDIKINPIWYQTHLDENGNKSHEQLIQVLNYAIDCTKGKIKV